MTTLHDRLADLAELADQPLGEGPGPDLWRAGVRQGRRRRAAVLLSAIALVGISAVLASSSHLVAGPRPAPATNPSSDPHLPLAVYPPSPWAEGTDENGAPGRLAVVSMVDRNHAHGIRGTQRRFWPFGVSAADGSAQFLDLTGTDPTELGQSSLALSPDGTKVGYLRYTAKDRVFGVAIYDAIAGTTRMLSNSRFMASGALEGTDLRFSDDSRYLETTMVDRDSSARWRQALVVWDVTTGAAVVAEPAGHYWQPSLGSGPNGIVWSRAARTFTFDPVTRRTSRVRTPFDVVEASYGPDGRAFAAIAFGAKKTAAWRLYVGPSAEHLRLVRLPTDADQLIGWRDSHHVVVRQLPSGEVEEVDVRTGGSVAVPVAVEGHQMMLPSYAADLWESPLAAGRRPAQVHDPRLRWWIGGGLALPAIACGALRWRRRRARS